MVRPMRDEATARLLLSLAALISSLGVGCARPVVPDPSATIAAYRDAAQRGDAAAMHELLTDRGKASLGREGVARVMGDGKAELSQQAQQLDARKIEAKARVRFGDGEEATLVVEEGTFKVTSADALPAAAKTPTQALSQLRKVLARRSYAGLMRVLSRDTRAAVERDLRSLVEGLERPDSLEVKVQGDTATVQVPGGHIVKLRREGSTWSVDDFD